MRAAIVDLRPGRCTCGCGTPVQFAFKQGHATALRSTIKSAAVHRCGVLVRVGPIEVSVTPEVAAAYLDGPAGEWSAWLEGIKR